MRETSQEGEDEEMYPEEIGLVDKIGKTATIELLAEEATELSFACQKYVRMLRGENPAFGYSEEGLVAKIHEEIADVMICLSALCEVGMLDVDALERNTERKVKRIEERFAGKKEAARDDES